MHSFSCSRNERHLYFKAFWLNCRYWGKEISLASKKHRNAPLSSNSSHTLHGHQARHNSGHLHHQGHYSDITHQGCDTRPSYTRPGVGQKPPRSTFQNCKILELQLPKGTIFLHPHVREAPY